MTCRICGSDDATTRANEIGTVCDLCNRQAKRRVILSREDFDLRYWGSDYGDVPRSIRSEFYSDYCASGLGFERYQRETSEAC